MEPDTVNESHEGTGAAFPTSPAVSTPPSPPPVSSPPDNSAPHFIHVTPPLHPIIDQIQRDNIASILLKFQLPAMTVAMAFTLISTKSEHYKLTGIIMLVLLVLALLAFIHSKVLQDEHPIIAAVAELIGISLIATAFIYPMSVLLGGQILCYVPPIFGLVVAVMYIYRLATTSVGDTDLSQV